MYAVLFLAIIFAAFTGILAQDDEAMKTCRKGHSLDTCTYILNR